MRGRGRQVATALVAGMVLAGCGDGDGQTVAEKVAATADETRAGDPTGAATGPIAPAEGERPDALPDDVAVPAGLQSVMLLGGGDGAMGLNGSIADTDAPTAAEALAVALEADGWTVTRQDTGMDTVAGLNAERGDEVYAASFTSLGTRVSVQITYAAG